MNFKVKQGFQKIAIGTSLLLGGTISLFEVVQLWYGDDMTMQKFVETQTKSSDPSLSLPHRITIEMTPSKLTYNINDVVMLNTKVYNKEKKVLKPDLITFTVNKPYIKIDGDQMILKGTGRAEIKACIDSKPEPVCGLSEIMIIDPNLPF